MSGEIRPLPRFDYVLPHSVGEAIDLLRQHGAAAKLLAGGTDLLSRMKRGKSSPNVVIDLNQIAELSFIAVRGDAIHIGAGTRLAALYYSRDIRAHAAALADAIHVMSSPAIRNRATIGGNLCNASRCADTPAPLLALEAQVKLRNPNGERIVPIESFFTVRGNGSGKTVLKANELMTEVIIPRQAGQSAYLKFGRRRGSSTAIVSAAVSVATVDRKFASARVAVSAFGSTPVRAAGVERALIGASVDGHAVEDAAMHVKDEMEAITDFRASAAYRKDMAAVLIGRALRQAMIGGA